MIAAIFLCFGANFTTSAADAHGGGGGGGHAGAAVGGGVGHFGGAASEGGGFHGNAGALSPTGEHNFVPSGQLRSLSSRLRTGRLGYGYGYGGYGFGYGYGIGYSGYGGVSEGPGEETLQDDDYLRQQDRRRSSLGANQIVKNYRWN